MANFIKPKPKSREIFQNQRTMRIFLIVLFLSAALQGAGQGFFLGGSATFGSTWLLNKNVTSAPATDQTYLPSFGGSMGLTGELDFTDKFSIVTGMAFGRHTQGYKGADLNFKSSVKCDKWDFPVLLKTTARTGLFFEAGVQFSNFKNIVYSYSDPLIEMQEKRITEKYPNTYADAVIGIGLDKKIDFAKWHYRQAFYFSWGIRFSYSITDLKGVDAYGRDLSWQPVLNAHYEGEHRATHAMAFGLVAGLKYKITR